MFNPFNKSPKLNWQRLKSANHGLPHLYRTAVIGGWLIMSDNGDPCFVPNEHHHWDGNSYPIE